MDLLSNLSTGPQPLAEDLRPANLEQVVGQDHLLADTGPIARLLNQKRPQSIVFWGPPGTGKTTLARLIANQLNLPFHQISAVFSGVAELKKIFAQAEASQSRPTILFIDEIHRFNKAQQDALLGPMESGLITLIGATTENPSFSLNSALLSRAQVLVLNRLADEALIGLIERVVQEKSLELNEDVKSQLASMADGDGRMLMNMLEILLEHEGEIHAENLETILQKRFALYDRNQEYHYNLISALIKSMRGSDPDAALYWFTRMLEGGEDPLYIARRLLRFATEDIGLADPQALVHANAAMQTYQAIGSPEGDLAIANSVIYLATAPKSNAAYTAYKAAVQAAKSTGSNMPPKIILNAPTKLMKSEGYGEGYIYDHDTEHGFSGQNYFPDGMPRPSFYSPKERGFERDILKRLDYWVKIRGKK